jgi:hypothetical protein
LRPLARSRRVTSYLSEISSILRMYFTNTVNAVQIYAITKFIICVKVYYHFNTFRR